MPPFGPLPRSPILVLAVALVSPAAAEQPVSQPPPEDVVKRVAIEVEVRAATKGELDDRAEQAALLRVLGGMTELSSRARNHLALRHTPRELLAHTPDFLPMERVDKRVRKAEDGAFVGTFTFEVDPAAVERMQQALQPKWATPIGTVGETLLGHFVVVDPDVDFLPGDRIVSVNGAPATSAVIAGIGHGVPIVVEREGVPMALTSPVQQIDPVLYDDQRELAPTCGPCCHGDCDDREIYGPSGPVKKRRGGR